MKLERCVSVQPSPFLHRLAVTLIIRPTPLEALPYCRRLLELAGREERQEGGRSLAVETALVYGGALTLLGRFTEARKVRVCLDIRPC
jgi:hypothetical protein